MFTNLTERLALAASAAAARITGSNGTSAKAGNDSSTSRASLAKLEEVAKEDGFSDSDTDEQEGNLDSQAINLPVKIIATQAKRRSAITSTAMITLLEKDFPTLALLRQAFENAAAISHVASALILKNQRFIQRSDRPAVDEIWTIETAEDTTYTQLISQELGQDANKVGSISEFSTWQQKFSSATLTDFTLDIDFLTLTERFQSLCRLNKEVLRHYARLPNNEYSFSLIPLEKLRYFERELLSIAALGEKFQVWMKNIAQQEYRFHQDFDWPSVENFSKAIEHLAATAMVLCTIFLSMKNASEHAQEQKNLLSNLPETISEEAQSAIINENIDRLTKSIAIHAKKIVEQQAILDAIKEAPLKYIEREENRINTKIQEVEANINEIQGSMQEQQDSPEEPEKRNDTAINLSAYRENSRLYYEALDRISNNPQQHLEYATQNAQELIKKELLVMNLEVGELNKIQQDEEEERQTKAIWKQDFPKGIALLAVYAKQDLLQPLIPTSIQFITYDVDYTFMPTLLEEYSAAAVQSDIKQYVHKNNRSMLSGFDQVGYRVRSKQSSPASSPSAKSSSSKKTNEILFDFEIFFKSKKGALSCSLVVSAEHCQHRDVFDRVEMVPANDPLPQSVSAAIAEACRAGETNEMVLPESTQHALHQLEVTSRMKKSVEKMEEASPTSMSFLNPFRSTKQKNYSSQVYHTHAMSKGNQRALHALIYATEPADNLLRKLLSELELRYNLHIQPSSRVEVFVDRLENQVLFFKLFTARTETEAGFFTSTQLIYLSQGNLFLKLYCIRETVESLFLIENDLLRIRIQTILKVFEKMMKNIELLPDWVDFYFDKSSFMDVKNVIGGMERYEKIKLAFGFALQLFGKVFSSLRMHEIDKIKALSGLAESNDIDALEKISAHFSALQVEFGFPFVDQKEANDLALNFFLDYADELLANTNIIKKDAVFVEMEKPSAHPEENVHKVKARSSFSFLSSALRVSNIKASKAEKPEVSNAVNQSVSRIIVSEDYIAMQEMSGEMVVELLDSQFSVDFVNQIREMLPQEKILGRYFIDRTSAAADVIAEADVQDEEEVDEYSSALARQKYVAEERASLDIEFNQVFIPDHHAGESSGDMLVGMGNNAQLHAAFESVKIVATILRELVLKDASIDTNDSLAIPALDFSSTRVNDWTSQLEKVCKLQQTSFFEEKLFVFSDMLTAIDLLGQDEHLMRLLLSQNTTTISKFSKAVNHLAMTIMLLCIIVLAVKKEQKLRPYSNRSQAINPAWNEHYNIGIRKFFDYANKLKSLDQLKIFSNIVCELPFVEARVAKVFGGIEPKNQCFTIELILFEADIVVRLRGQENSIFCALYIKPTQLHPSIVDEQILLNENERATFSPLKVVDIYSSLVKLSNSPKSVGAEEEIRQINALSKLRRSYSREDTMLLAGIYGLFHFALIQRTVSKSVRDSRFAQALEEISLKELGVDLKKFHSTYRNSIFPEAFSSTNRKKSGCENSQEIQSVLFALQLATLTVHYHVSESMFAKDNMKLEFAIRGNPYLQLLSIPAIIEKRDLLKGSSQAKKINLMLSIIDNVVAIIDNLPLRIATFLDQTRSADMMSKVSGLTDSQKINVVFVLLVEFYRVIFSMINSNIEKVFAYLQTGTSFSFDHAAQGFAFSLGAEFFGKNGLLTTNSSRIEYATGTLSSSSAPPGVKSKTIADTRVYANASLAEVGEPDPAERRKLLSSKNINTFFDSIKITPDRDVLLAEIVAHLSRNKR